MLKTKYATKFKKDVKRLKKRKKDMSKLKAAIETLERQEPLASRYKPHLLTGDYLGYSECHLEPDWVLIYRVNGNVLELTRTGRHQDVFKKY